MLGLAGKSLVWFLAGVAVALGFLLVPLQVAAERKKLDRTAAEILRAHRDIRALETEFETRASLAQLDRWNADTLKLVAPAADQFVPSEHALALLDLAHPTPAGPGTRLVAFVPAGPVDTAAAMTPAVATTATSTPVATSTPAATPVVAAVVAPPREAAPVAHMSRVAVASTGAEPPHRRRDVALLDRSLLDDSLLGDLRNGARAERSAAR